MKTRVLMASVAVVATLAVTPVLANGLFCGKKDLNGCSVSPVTFKSCLKDLRGDVADLNCDIIGLIKDVYKGKSIAADLADLKEDLLEIGYDKSVLAQLTDTDPRKKWCWGWHGWGYY